MLYYGNLPTPTSPSTWWQPVGNMGASIFDDVVELQDGRLLGVGTDKALYTNKLNGNTVAVPWWTQLDMKGRLVTKITQLQDGRLLAVGTDQRLYTNTLPLGSNVLGGPWVSVSGVNSGWLQDVEEVSAGIILAVGTCPIGCLYITTLASGSNAVDPWKAVEMNGGFVKSIIQATI
jgi:hypothetical protein